MNEPEEADVKVPNRIPVFGMIFTWRETIFLAIILIIAMAFFFNIKAYQDAINSDQKAYNDCVFKLNMVQYGEVTGGQAQGNASSNYLNLSFDLR